MIKRSELVDLYQKEKLSASEIAVKFSCSVSGINYWLSKHGIPKRTISEAIYQKRNPCGDPFLIRLPKNISQAIAYGIGLGLYWGEGNKRNLNSVRLGNTDPRLIKKFINFLLEFGGVKKERLKFGLQVFGDINESAALSYWSNELGVGRGSFQKVVKTKKRGEGTYRYSAPYGVLTVYFNNKKFRNLLCQTIEKL